MDDKILTGLRDLGYNGPLLNRDQFNASVSEGQKNVQFTEVVHYLTNEIRTLNSIDEEVNVISSPEDSVAFIMELTSFLKELSCPYASLTQGHVSDRLESIEDRYLLLDYLTTELMAARILQEIKPDKKIELKLKETPEAADMKNVLMALRFSKPPPNINIPQLFQKIIPTVENAIRKCGSELLGTPMFCGHLSEKQWEVLGDVQKDLYNEYKIRREMLLTRLDCTIQSFEWSDAMKGKNDLIEKVYAGKRKVLKADPNVDISDLLAARDDLAIIEKTSSSSVRRFTQSSLNKVIIGTVPDRGGRTNEIAPPPPEMPSWQQRVAGPPRGGGGRGGGSYQGGGQGRQSYNQGGGGRGGSYNKPNDYGGNNYSSGNYRGFDSAGSFGGDKRDSGSYRSAGAYSSEGGGSSGISNNYSRLANFDTSLRISQSSSFSGSGGGGSGYSSRDSKGGNGYGKSDYEQINKRPKTYDSFQSSRTTYTDQYVQESQSNKQYHQRGDRNYKGDRGSGSYRRGGGQNY